MVKTLALLAYLLGGAQSHETPLQVASSALRGNQPIPTQYTCRGRNVSVPLRWKHVPPGTRSLAIIMTDESEPRDKRYLWVVYNIPPRKKWLGPDARLVRGEQYGINSWGHVAYDGPCPAKGEHHYRLRLYALNTYLYFDRTIPAARLKKAMQGHVIASAALESWYSAAISSQH